MSTDLKIDLDSAALLLHVAQLTLATADLDYSPHESEWVCGPHGMPECTQGACPQLPWPKPNGDPLLAAFTCWADGEFQRAVRPYDESEDPNREMPDEAFRSFSLWEWPLGAFLDAVVSNSPANASHSG